MRTPEEMKAYVDGYNACHKQFIDCLNKRKKVNEAIKLMEVYVAVVNSIGKEV